MNHQKIKYNVGQWLVSQNINYHRAHNTNRKPKSYSRTRTISAHLCTDTKDELFTQPIGRGYYIRGYPKLGRHE